jgi:hypothetical protein
MAATTVSCQVFATSMPIFAAMAATAAAWPG